MKRTLAIAGLGLTLWAGAAAKANFVDTAKAAGTVAPAITDGPRVEYVSSHHAVIGWTTDAAASTVLHYGTSKENLVLSERSRWTKTNHRISLSKLKANTIYYFRATSSLKNGATVSSGVETFKTAPKGDPPTRMLN
jgi:hypothetical protein